MAIWRVAFSKDAFEGEKEIYRLRIGKYRILLKFLKEEATILIVRIGSRGDIYK